MIGVAFVNKLDQGDTDSVDLLKVLAVSVIFYHLYFRIVNYALHEFLGYGADYNKLYCIVSYTYSVTYLNFEYWLTYLITTYYISCFISILLSQLAVLDLRIVYRTIYAKLGVSRLYIMNIIYI